MVQQVLFRAGASSRTLALVCEPSDDVLSVKHALSGQARRLVGSPDDMVLVHEGRVLQDGTQLASYPSLVRQAGASTSYASSSGPAMVHVLNRLRGGGGDGGSTGAESRSCYLEMYAGKKADKVNPLESLIARFTRCQISGAELSPPCVVDELGCLYNKDALLAALLAKSLPPHLSYITGLKSVTELKLTRKKKAANGGNGGGSGAPTAAVKGLHNPGNDAEFCCPITDLEFNGRFKFVVHRPTGYAVSEKAAKELPLVVEELVGSKPSADDWIPVNPSGEQLEALKVKAAAKLAAEREKKAKKAAAKQQQQQQAVENGGAAAQADAPPATNGKPREASPGPTATAGGGEAANGKLTGQKREGSGSPTPAPAAAAAGLPPPGPAAKKAKAAPALAAMPKNATSSVYASLFTSSLPEGADKETYLCRNTSARGVHLT